MKKYFGAILFCLLFTSFACKTPQKEATPDWLLKPEAFKAKIELAANREILTLGNELIRRTFRLVPDCATVEKIFILPLYYTGLTDEAKIREQEGETKTYRLDRKYEVQLPVKVGPNSFTWFVIE